MNFWNLVYRAAEYGIILPGIFLCIIPVADWLIIPQRKLYPVLLPCMVAVCFVLAWLDSSGSYYTNIFFFPLLGICLIAYFLTGKVEITLHVFMCNRCVILRLHHELLHHRADRSAFQHT